VNRLVTLTAAQQAMPSSPDPTRIEMFLSLTEAVAELHRPMDN
jgi:hypothetical protein